MGDMAEIYREMRENKKSSAAWFRTLGASELTNNSIPFVSKNNGAHLIVEGNDGYIDFWPGTGKWIVRSPKFEGFGIKNLLEYILC